VSPDPDDLADDASRQVDREDASASHEADRPPTPEKEAASEELELNPPVAEHLEEVNEIGADVKGEGEIEP